MKKYYCLILSAFIFYGSIQGQADRFVEAVKSALHKDQYFTDYDFFGGSALDSLNIAEQYRFAETARRMFALSLAEAGYLRVIRLDTMDKEVDFPIALYQVGAMKKLRGNYAEALIYFEKYISSPPPIDNKYLAAAKKDIDDCKFAIPRTQRFDNQYSVQHLGAEVNTPFNDFSPLLVDGLLYFSSLKYQKEEKMNPPRLYAKTLISDLEIGATPLAGFNKKEQSVANIAFTKDQQRAYFTICDYTQKSRKIRCKIYYQEKLEDGNWGTAKALPKHINRNDFSASHPTVGYNETGQEFLLFSSDCPGGKGQIDIWKTEVNENGDFSKPTNYVQINTSGNDLTPFFHQSTNTLYFSSDGRIGLGGYDIYSLSNGEIKHGGYPLNGSFNDTHFTLDPSRDKGYFSSSREGCLRLSEYDMGCQDIYEATFINIDLEALTFDDFTKQDLSGVQTQLYRLSEGENNEEIAYNEPILIDGHTNSLDNQFQFTGLLRDARYQLVATKEGYIGDTLTFNTRGITESITLKKELYLAPDIFEMDLTVLTFDEENRNSLTHCIVQLIDKASGERFILDNINGNDFYFDIYSQKEYRLIASHIGYTSDTLDFNTKDYTKTGNTSIIKRMYLAPGGIRELDDLLPLTLYFDNDFPDPRSRTVTTTNNYEELYGAYFRKKREFIAKYTEGIPTVEVPSQAQKVIDFFDKDLKGNYDTLGVFSETLIKYLQRGNTAVISIRGFASPLADTPYNINLGKRRVDCIMNHFSTYRDGMLTQFIQAGSLVLEEISFGEAQADKSISENPHDRRNSVYSPAASRERKIQIVKITIGEKSEGE